MEKANLVHHGTNLMLDRVLKDLQVPKFESFSCFALQQEKMPGATLLWTDCPFTFPRLKNVAPSNSIRRSYTDLHAVMAAWQAEDESLQARALQALQGFAKGKRGGVSMPMQAMQEAFQKGGGLPRLVALLDRAATPKPGTASQRKAITSGAVDALAAMTRNHASARCLRITKMQILLLA